MLMKLTNTTSMVLRPDDSFNDVFETSETQTSAQTACTLGRYRLHTSTSCDAMVWERFIHARVMEVPNLRTIKTISTKYHLEPCDRCHTRICGVRWERVCCAAGEQPKALSANAASVTTAGLASPTTPPPPFGATTAHSGVVRSASGSLSSESGPTILAPAPQAASPPVAGHTYSYGSPPSSSMLSYTQGDPFIESEQPSSPRETVWGNILRPAPDAKNTSPSLPAAANHDPTHATPAPTTLATSQNQRGSPFGSITPSSLTSLANSIASTFSAATAPIFTSGSPNGSLNSSKKRKSIPPLMRPFDSVSNATNGTSDFHSNSTPTLPTVQHPYPQTHQMLAATTTGVLPTTQDRGLLGTSASAAPTYVQKEYQPPKRALSLCMLCFDSLHSDFGLSPLSHRKVANQEHEDTYYKGYLWAHVRCLFDSATQPLIPTLADEEEIAKADAAWRSHHQHHHHGSTHRSNQQGSGSGAALNTSEGFVPRHIGSDQSIHSSSSGAESGTSSLPFSESSTTSRADAQSFTMSTIKIRDLNTSSNSNSALDEWVLMEALPHSKLDMEYMSDEERSEHSFSRSSRDRESAYTSDPEDFDTRSHHSDTSDSSNEDATESLFDAGKRQALNFLVQDDMMRPVELSDAIQPFIQAIEPSKLQSTKKKNGPSSLSTPGSGQGPIFFEPEPVFELTADLQTELAAHKARSVFEYGLNRDWNPLPPSQTLQNRSPTPAKLGGLPPLSALSSLDIVVDPVMPSTPSTSYGGAASGYGAPSTGYGAPSSGYGAPTSIPASGYGPVSSAIGYAPSSALPSGYASGDHENGYLAAHNTTSGYFAPSEDSWNGASTINPYGEPTPQRTVVPAPSTSSIAPSSITPYLAASDERQFAPHPSASAGAAQPYSDVPFAQAGATTPPSVSAGAYSETPMRHEKGQDEPNDPYFTESSNLVLNTAGLGVNEPEPDHRDWNSEWQALISELIEFRTDTLHMLATEPRTPEEVWERERSMTSLLHEAGIADMQSLDKFYAPDANSGGDAADASTPDDDVLQLAKDVLSTATDPKARLQRLSDRLNEMVHLKADKSRFTGLILCLIRIKEFLAEFMDTASRLAKTIVTEMTLPVEAKKIKPRNMGGIAGGEKYLEEGIFFKFAIDAYNVYGGDKFAMKAAAHELQGIKAFAETDIKGLFVPLSLLVDYAGYRLVASVRLPISQNTLIYGSSDGGATIHQKDPIFNRMMEEAATHINIKQHEVAPGVSLYSAVDMEGHKGTDGRYYVLDTARVFPPEPPLRTFIAVNIPNDTTSSHKWSPSPPIGEIELIAIRSRWQDQVRQHLLTGHRSMTVDDISLLEGQIFFLLDPHRTLPLNSRASALAGCIIRGPAIYVVEPGQGSTQLFNLLRAPYVARQPHALSSDAFTSFGRIDQDIHNTEVEDAFYRLLGIDIPQFVKFITLPENNNALTHDLLITTIKSYGINLRLLGFLRSHIPFNSANRAIRSMILGEMVARVAKNGLRAALRSSRSIRRTEMCFTPSMCERQAHEIVLSSFNVLLGNSTSSTFLWHSFMKTHIIVKYGQYGQALTEAELDPAYDLRNEINKLQLFQTMAQQAGIKFKDEVVVKFQQHPDYFEVSAPFGPDDIEDMVPKRKSHLNLKIEQYFNVTLKALPTITQRLEAMRAFHGPGGRELGYTALNLAHVLHLFEATVQLVPAAIDFALSIFNQSPGTTPSEVTTKAFYLLATASLSRGDYDMAEAQLKASYNSYRRVLANHIASRPLEVGATFLMLILDRIVWLMDRQNRRYEAWYYAQKFVRIWQSVPYPGDVKDLEGLLRRATPLSFALLWERDYYLSAGQRTFLNSATGQVTDNAGNVYNDTSDMILSQRTGRVYVKSNLADETLQELPELTPETRLQIEHELFKDTAVASEGQAQIWRSVFKTVDGGNLSGFNMSAKVWDSYIKSGAWKKDRLFDAKTLRRAIWTPSTSLLYGNNILRNGIGPLPGTAEMDDDEMVARLRSPLATNDPSKVNLTTSKPSQLNNMASNSSITSSSTTHYSSATLMTGSTALTATSASITPTSSDTSSTMYAMYANAGLPSSTPPGTVGPQASPCLPASVTSPNASPLAGTIKAPHILKSGKQDAFTFSWHLGREWNREITGTEHFVLVRYEPNVWVLPAMSGNNSVANVTREGRRILTGPEIGQFIEGQHVVVATMPARLMRTFGEETWHNLDLDYGFYQVHLVSATGQLWGRTTSIPCFVLTHPTLVLNRTAKHHVLRWNESSNWMSSVFQAQGIAFTNLTFLPLGQGYGTAYWTDANNQLWYGYGEPTSHSPPYLRKTMPAEEVQHLQLNPLIMPMPSDFAQTFQQISQVLGTDISVFAAETQGNLHNAASQNKRRSTAGLQSSSTGSHASKSGTLNRTLSPPNLNAALSASTSGTSSQASSHASSFTAITSTNGSLANAAAAAAAAALAPYDLERAQSASSFSTGRSSSASSKARSANGSSSSSGSKVLTEDFWKEQNKCEASCAFDTSVLHFDAIGGRVPAGSSAAANSVIVLKSVESQLSPGMIWAKMRKLPSLATEKVTKVVTSNSHVMALLANGDVYTWGNNLYGELGHGDLVRLEEPRVVKRLRGKQVRDIGAGLGRSIALLSGNRTVYQWGLDFSLFPEPHPFWKSLPDEEVVRVVFQSQNGLGSPLTFDPDIGGNIPTVPKDLPSYRIFETPHTVTTNPLWHSNLMLYLTDTGRAYLYGHDPYQLLFKQQKPILLDVVEDQPVLDAAIGSNFISFIGEDGTVWSTGHNELGQRGTGIVGDPTLDNAPKRAPLRSSVGPVSARSGYEELSAVMDRLSRRAAHDTEHTTATTTHTPSLANNHHAAWIRPTAQHNGPRHSSLSDSNKSRGNTRSNVFATTLPDPQTIAWEEERANHPMNHAILPAAACKVSFSEPTKIVKLVARSKKVIALTHEGNIWHWGNGVYVPSKLTTIAFSVCDVAIHSTGALLHTGSSAPPVQVLSERGRTRRKALGLEKPSLGDIQAHQMLWTPSGLKPWVEGSAVPSKCHVVVAIDWRRPPPTAGDPAIEIRFVTPGSDKIENVPRAVSEIAIKLPALPQRRGQYVIDYLNPRVTKWSIDQGIANGNLDVFLEPLLTWAPLTEEAREVLSRRRDRRAANVRQLLIERQNRMLQEARALAEQRFNEMRSVASAPVNPLSASSSYSNLPPLANNAAVYGSASMPPMSPSPSVTSPAPMTTSDDQKLSIPSLGRPMTRRASRSTLIRQQQQERAQPGSAASSSAGRAEQDPLHAPNHGWDGSAAFLDVDSTSSGIADLLHDSSFQDYDPDQEEYSTMVPPGEYEVVMVATKPSLQILARSKPVRFTYEGVKASIEVQNSNLSDKRVIATWKCEMKLPGLRIIARELESHKVIVSERLMQRTQGTVNWRLRAGSYRIFIERTDESERTHALCESEPISIESGNNSILMFANLNKMPMEVEICTEWSTFFGQQCGLPADVVHKYSGFATAAGIQTTFAISLDSGFLEKIGITDLAHQVSILTAVHRHREAHVRAIIAQEFQKMVDQCESRSSQLDTSASTSSLHQ